MYLLFKSQISRQSTRTSSRTSFRIWRRQSAGNENKIPVIIRITGQAKAYTLPRRPLNASPSSTSVLHRDLCVSSCPRPFFARAGADDQEYIPWTRGLE